MNGRRITILIQIYVMLWSIGITRGADDQSIDKELLQFLSKYEDILLIEGFDRETGKPKKVLRLKGEGDSTLALDGVDKYLLRYASPPKNANNRIWGEFGGFLIVFNPIVPDGFDFTTSLIPIHRSQVLWSGKGLRSRLICSIKDLKGHFEKLKRIHDRNDNDEGEN